MEPGQNSLMAKVYVEHLIAYGRTYLSLPYLNTFYARNQLLDILQLDSRSEDVEKSSDDLAVILAPLLEYALGRGLCDEMGAERFGVRLVACVMPSPQETVDRYDTICFNDGMRAGCAWFYEFCQRSGYIPLKTVMKNPRWKFAGTYGEINVTINTAKPEKDPKEVAAAKAAPQSGYPKCLLCAENIGYPGRVGWPARGTLRVLPVPREDELWFMQYSPYSYFTHHCIFFNAKHQPMVWDHRTLRRLMDFVEAFPYYFVGSNAPLPIVGGSILAHDHYQGGGKVHPMFSRSLVTRYTTTAYPAVKVGIVDWYNSVIRLKSRDRGQLLRAANFVADSWAAYSDPAANILCRTGETQHNCVTPICRLERGEMFIELILRNNRTDEQHPFGIFHPTEDMHHIKKESIGIIEAIGTFILPGRLAGELDAIADILCGATPFSEKELQKEENPLSKHKEMIVALLAQNGLVADKEVAKELVRKYINDVCERILGCTAVFKRDEQGQKAFDTFMRSMGYTEYVYKMAEDYEAQPAEPSTTEAVDAGAAAEAAPAAAEVSAAPVETPAAEVDWPAEAAAQPADAAPAEAPAEEKPVRRRGRPRKNPVA